MDPIENLREQLACAERIIHNADAGHPLGDDAERLAELVILLNAWRKSGGFDPGTV